MPVAGALRIKDLFHAAAGVTIDLDDVKRYQDFVYDKLNDLLLMGVVSAKDNGRDVIRRSDLPITKGLQERMREFDKLADQIAVESVMEQLATYPPLDAAVGEDAEERLPSVVGGLTVALARCFVVLEPERKNPGTEQWDKAIELFDLLL
jgi:hypothetical protein